MPPYHRGPPTGRFAIGTRRTTFDKLQRERAKKAKAAAKRERRHGDRPEADPLEVVDRGEQATPAELLELIEALHKRYEAEQLELEEFEEQRAELYDRLANATG
jgi:hypothetical protein